MTPRYRRLSTAGILSTAKVSTTTVDGLRQRLKASSGGEPGISACEIFVAGLDEVSQLSGLLDSLSVAVEVVDQCGTDVDVECDEGAAVSALMTAARQAGQSSS